MVQEDELFVVVNDALIRNSDYWQNFLDGNILLCTTHVTDMSDLFAKNKYFNQDISRWDTSRVTNMDRMFSGTKRFDQLNPLERQARLTPYRLRKRQWPV